MLAYAPPRESVRKSPSTLTIVVGLHAAALAALMLVKPDMIQLAPPGPDTEIYEVPLPPPPPPPPQPQPEQVQPELPTPPVPQPIPFPTVPDPLVPIPLPGPPPVATGTILVDAPPAPEGVVGGTRSPSASALVRTEARLKTPPHRLKPDYPASKRRSGEEALLRLRLEIDAAGRVTRVTPLGEFDSVFFASAERHILKNWRYEPATLGGDAIADDTVVSLQFTLDD